MRRLFNGDRTPNLKPVEKIELSDKNVKLRFVITVIAVIVAVAAIGYGVHSCVSAEKGWQVITSDTAAMSCTSSFTFIYNVGNNGGSPTVENRAVKMAYGNAAINAYRLFETSAEDGELKKINKNVGVDVEIDPSLYSALKTMLEMGGRTLYYAPYHERYEVLFGADRDDEAAAFDPEKNADTAALFDKLSKFIIDPASVSLSLKGNNTVRLDVSEEYKTFAADNDIDSFVGFSWLKNAFIADYIADFVASTGYSSGYLVSNDGFYRDLGAAGKNSSKIYYRSCSDVYVACRVDNAVVKSGAFFYDFPISSDNNGYVYENGDTVMAYINGEGRYKNAAPTMYAYSKSASCAETALAAGNVYINDTLETSELKTLSDGGVETICIRGGTIYYTEGDVSIADVLDDGIVSLKKERVN